jgi:hypothetical protein
MKPNPHPVLLLLLAFALLMSACSRSTPAPEPAPVQPTLTGAPAQPPPPGDPSPQPPASSTNFRLPRGPGDFDLTRPGQGLEGLSSYTQRFESTFTGSSTRITRSVMTSPQGVSASLSATDQDGEPLEIWGAWTGGAVYLKTDPQIACQGRASSDFETGEIPDPAGLLPHVYGAVAAGEETIRGIPTLRYDFDQRSVPLHLDGQGSGSVWVAREGGFVVRYILEISGSSTLGADLDGVQAWQYEVQDLNSLASLVLPEDCLPVLADFPVPADAVQVERLSGVVTYATPVSVDQVSAFYREQLAAAGWSEVDYFEPSAGEAALSFVRPSENTQTVALILIEPSAEQTEVYVLVFEEDLPPAP